jgi:hypothetical protein
MDFAKLIQFAFDEYEDFQDAPDKKQHSIDRTVELYLAWAEGKDADGNDRNMPGPDALFNFMATKALEMAVGLIFEAITDLLEQDEDGIDLIVGRKKRRGLVRHIPAIARELAAMKAEGNFDTLDRADVPQYIFDRLKDEVAADGAFRKRFLAFVKFILPFLLLFI